jgi:hypothetical protein
VFPSWCILTFDFAGHGFCRSRGITRHFSSLWRFVGSVLKSLPQLGHRIRSTNIKKVHRFGLILGDLHGIKALVDVDGLV